MHKLGARILFALFSIFVIGMAVAAVTSGPPANADAATLLGRTLPTSTRDAQVELRRGMLDEYTAYVRFTLDPADVSVLLQDAVVQPVNENGAPWGVFDGAQRGNHPLQTDVVQRRPAWWQPESGTRWTLARRSGIDAQSTTKLPDNTWYIIDTSNPARAVVYAYVVEV